LHFHFIISLEKFPILRSNLPPNAELMTPVYKIASLDQL